MSYRKGKGLVCDGCEAPVDENDPKITTVRIRGQQSLNGSEFTPRMTTRRCVKVEKPWRRDDDDPQVTECIQ